MLRVDAILKATDELKVDGSGVRWSDPEGKVYEIIGDLSDSKITEIETKADELLAEWATQAYARARKEDFPTWQEQMDMQYWDQVNGTTTWKDAIAKVKADHPKP